MRFLVTSSVGLAFDSPGVNGHSGGPIGTWFRIGSLLSAGESAEQSREVWIVDWPGDDVQAFARQLPPGCLFVGLGSDVQLTPALGAGVSVCSMSLDRLVSQIPALAYFCRQDRHWTMEDVRGCCEDLTGYRADELVHSRVVSYASLIHPDDRDMVYDTVFASIRERKPFEIRYRIRTRSGLDKWVWELGYACDSGGVGGVQGLEGLILDAGRVAYSGAGLLDQSKGCSNPSELVNECIERLRPLFPAGLSVRLESASADTSISVGAQVFSGMVMCLIESLSCDLGPGNLLTVVTRRVLAPGGVAAKGIDMFELVIGVAGKLAEDPSEGGLSVTTSGPNRRRALVGLGLKTLASSFGGSLTMAENRSLGRQVSLMLPAKPRPVQETPPEEVVQLAAATRHKNVLLVDDDPAIVLLLERLLRRAGYRVFTANDCGHALDVAQMADETLDILLTDVMLGRETGCDLASRLRLRLPFLKVVYMSGYAADSRVVEEVSSGHASFIAKPFLPSTVLSALGTAAKGILVDTLEDL